MSLTDTSDLRIEPPKAAQTVDAPKGLDSGFNAGRALAVIDPLCLTPPDFSGTLRQRLALRAATSVARRQRLITEEQALRDLWLLRTSDSDPAPAGRIYRAFRSLASDSNPLRLGALTSAAEDLGISVQTDWITDVQKAAMQLVQARINPLLAAATIATFVGDEDPRMDSFALWLADAVLAISLKWPFTIPLLATQQKMFKIRANGLERRVRFTDKIWPEICVMAYTRAFQELANEAADLARRADTLKSVAQKLRAKGSDHIIHALLNDDALTPASILSGLSRPFSSKAAASDHHAGSSGVSDCTISDRIMSDRALRRLFDRLQSLGAVRELTGRPTFRIYGL